MFSRHRHGCARTGKYHRAERRCRPDNRFGVAREVLGAVSAGLTDVQWSDVTRVPEPRTLRAFAGLCLLCFGGLAALRLSRGHMDGRTVALGIAATAVGGPGPLRADSGGV